MLCDQGEHGDGVLCITIQVHYTKISVINFCFFSDFWIFSVSAAVACDLSLLTFVL